MKTVKRKYRKLYCKNRLILMWLIVMVSPILAHAQYAIAPYDNDNIVTDISYDYELTDCEHQGLLCYGTLNLTLKISDDIERLILEHTSPHHPEDLPPKFLIKRELPLDDQVELQNYPWRIRFRIWIHYKDGSRKFSDIYNINDYIKEEDIYLLYEASSTSTLPDDGVNMTLDNGILNIRIPGEGNLDIFESSGKMICSKTIMGIESFDINSLNKSKAPIIFIKLHAAEKTVIKKIHIK